MRSQIHSNPKVEYLFNLLTCWLNFVIDSLVLSSSPMLLLTRVEIHALPEPFKLNRVAGVNAGFTD